MRSLFADAPVMPPGQPVQGGGNGTSSLAMALMGGGGMPQMKAPALNIPLGSLQSLMAPKGADGATAPIWNPNNPVGTETLGGLTANQGSGLANAGASGLGWLSRLFGGGGGAG